MVSKINTAFASIASIAAIAGVFSFTGLGVDSQADAQGAVTASSVRCFIAAKMDRPDTHMTRGWVCLPERTPVVTN